MNLIRIDMTRVDFYILQGDDAHTRPLFTCRLAEKAYALGHRVYIHTESATQTTHLDELLWTFKQDSFLPHAVQGAEPDAPSPILLGHAAEPDANTDVLINLAPEVPLFFSRFERVAELIDQQEQRKRQGRERYSFYRDRGYELQTHQL
jgi:DNA polymerase-3 subunit chi